jgi:hypothetical protein
VGTHHFLRKGKAFRFKKMITEVDIKLELSLVCVGGMEVVDS